MYKSSLQSIQNSLAWAVMKTPKYDHLTPVLKPFHWLPARQQIDFEITWYYIQTSHHISSSCSLSRLIDTQSGSKMHWLCRYCTLAPFLVSAHFQWRGQVLVPGLIWSTETQNIPVLCCLFARTRTRKSDRLVGFDSGGLRCKSGVTTYWCQVHQ